MAEDKSLNTISKSGLVVIAAGDVALTDSLTSQYQL